MAEDDPLLRLLGEALREAGPRAGTVRDEAALLDGARAAFSFRTIEAELAELSYDSLLDADPVGAGRATGNVRTLVFETGIVSVEVEVTAAGMIGQIMPPATGRVTAVSSTGRRTETVTDDLGCFTLELPGPGPAQLHITTPGGTVATPWTDLSPPSPT